MNGLVRHLVIALGAALAILLATISDSISMEYDTVVEEKPVFEVSDTAYATSLVKRSSVNELETVDSGVEVEELAEEEMIEPDTTGELAEEEMIESDTTGEMVEEEYSVEYDVVDANLDRNWISSSDFYVQGMYWDSSGYSYTYYSENVLPGGGLDIPGRHVDEEGYVCDGDGNICIASDDLPKGTVVNVPFGNGTAVVYDCGSGYGNLDIYVSW